MLHSRHVNVADGVQHRRERGVGLFWRIFSADKPRRMPTLNELGLAPMQAMALTQPGARATPCR